MKGTAPALAASLAAALAATLLVAAPGHAQEQTRTGYREAVEQICERDTMRSQAIMRGARERIRNRNLAPAGRQFLRVSRTFGRAIGEIAQVPRPQADDARLRKWIGFLRIVRTRIQNLGRALVAGQRIKANHASIQLERSGNAANNAGYVFGFRECRLRRSRFG